MLALLATMALPAIAQSSYEDDDYGRGYYDDDRGYDDEYDDRGYDDEYDDYGRRYDDRGYYDDYDDRGYDDDPRDPQCGWYPSWDDDEEWWEYWCFWPDWGWEFVLWSW